jgi:hypothetical protein
VQKGGCVALFEISTDCVFSRTSMLKKRFKTIIYRLTNSLLIKKMFYRKEEVDKVLACGICSGIYEDPRFLPCSESACNRCIQKLIESNPKKEFDCNFCHNKHKPLDKEGFPLNGALIKLMSAKVGNVYRNAKVEELKVKLAEIKNKCEVLKLSLTNGVDEVKEHCIRLRNQVHLETDILIEEAHKFNESLIAEIDKYEKDCINSFDSNTKTNDNVFDKFILALNTFYTDNTKYLTEFEINEKVVDEAVAKADDHLRRFKSEDKSLKKIQFNGKVAEFRKCQNKHDRSLLGTLTYQPVNFEISNLKQLNLNTGIIKSYYSSASIFNNIDKNNYAFFINSSYYLNMICFDNDGKVIRENVNALYYSGGSTYSQVNQSLVAQLFDGFVIHVKLVYNLHYSSTAICGHTVNAGVIINNLMIKINRNNLAYLSHKVNLFGNIGLLHMVTNSSNILCIDSTYKYYCLDMNLAVISDKPLNAIITQVGNTIVNVQMNDQFVFFLCSSKKLKIFNVKTGNLVKEIDTNANQIKLVTTEYLILFDSINRKVHLYEQFGEFCKLDDIDLAQSLETGLIINRDKSKNLAFYNSTCMKYTFLD